MLRIPICRGLVKLRSCSALSYMCVNSFLLDNLMNKTKLVGFCIEPLNHFLNKDTFKTVTLLDEFLLSGIPRNFCQR